MLSNVTNFPNGITSYGIPVIGNGTIPAMTSKCNYYFVDVKYGSDSYNGLTPDLAFSTIAKAVTTANNRISWSDTRWATVDVIVIAPGVYAENLTALPYGCALIGLGDAFDLNGQRGVTVKPASGSPVDCTSIINSRIQNICFESPDTSPCFDVENLNRNVIINCVFAGLPGSSPSTTHGLRVKDETGSDGNGDMTGTRIINCVFQVCRNGIHITTDNGSSKQASGNIIEHCYIRGADQTGIYFHANCVPSYTQVNNCIIGDKGTTLALGIDDNSAIVSFANCMIWATATDPASDANYNHCYLNGTLLT